MEKKPVALFVCTFFAVSPLYAGVMRGDINVQDYRDFGENLGKYRPGETHVPVYRKDGALDGYLDFPVPDFSMVNSQGYATLLSPSYIVSVRHNGGYKDATWGNGAKYAATYTLINRNNHPTTDFHTPRLNKVVTDAAPAESITREALVTSDRSRFPWFARVGAGTQKQIDESLQSLTQLAAAYKWKSGGLMPGKDMTLNTMVRWSNKLTTPLSSAGQPGDSGSPVFVFDTLDQKWKLASVLASVGGSGIGITTHSHYMQDDFIADIMAANTDPDVTDSAAQGALHWKTDVIIQGENQWQWHGLHNKYASIAPAQASNEELDATKDLRFNGEGGNIILDDAINMGAGKLQFSGNYLMRSAADKDATWVGGGVEVDKAKTVIWQVNGLKDDALHKIGAGTLHINASGINAGSLNVGDGTVILDQQADANGKKQAFAKITLVSGRPTVVLNSADQIASQDIQFGYRGGTLDINGNALSFDEIKHNDDGARIVNHHASQAALLTLTGDKQIFLGQLGDIQSASRLNLRYQPQKEHASWRLAGGAELNDLSVARGELQLTGQQVLHAGNVYYSNDWDEKNYRINALNLEQGAGLTLGEHASLTTAASLLAGATLTLQAKSTLDGSVTLAASDAELRADISQRDSTYGALASRIDADISGAGKVRKSGEGLLTLTGTVSAAGGVALEEGELQVNGRLNTPLEMATGTLLSGRGTLAQVNMEGAAIAPGNNPQSGNAWSGMRIGNLNSRGENSVRLNTAFTAGATDRLLIDGDLNTAEGAPLMITVNPLSDWADSDSNGNGKADNREGVSLIQVGGKAKADSVKLAGSYVARGAWAYGLYAFAPGKSASDERQVSGEGDRFWDYRLQNIMLAENDNATPAPEPQPVPVPKPEPQPQPQPQPVPEPEPAPEPQPAPQPKPLRPAVIPQVPTYISMPGAFLRFDENMQGFFNTSAKEASSYFFASGYHGKDNYHSAGNFSNYGYDFKSHYHGWMMGTRWQAVEDEPQKLALSMGIAKGTLSLSPQARDGVSSGKFDTWSLYSLVSWDRGDGLTLDVPMGYSHFKGNVNTELRGKVASPAAKSWHLGINGGKRWQFGNHQVTPVLGVRYQHLDIGRFRDGEGASVRYKMHRTPHYSAGVKYDFTHALSTNGTLRLGSDLRLMRRPGKANQTLVGDGTERARFASGKGGDSLQLKTDASISLVQNVELTSQLQYQKRLHQEGVDDWGITGGMKVSF